MSPLGLVHAGIAYLPNVSAGHDISGEPGHGGSISTGQQPTTKGGARGPPAPGRSHHYACEPPPENSGIPPAGAEGGGPATVTTNVICTTTNVGFDQYGFTHPRGRGVGTALRQCLDEATGVGAHIAAIQEHKLGKHDYAYIPELKDDEEWEWLGFAGDKKGKRGLGFFLRKGVVVQGSKATSIEEGEVAALLALVHKVKVGAVNTYWAGKVSDESLTIMLEHTRSNVEELLDQGAQVVFLLGDLNIDMLKCTPLSRRLQATMLDELGMRRLDMEGPNAGWVTHVRGASHLDCIAMRASCDHEIASTWNRQWARVKKGTQDSVDHKSLGLSLNLTAVPEQVEEQQWSNVAHPVKYKYKRATEEQKAQYGVAFTATIDAGIQALADALYTRTYTEGESRQNMRANARAEVQVVTCLITAASHRAATKTMRQHRTRNEPCSRPKKKVGVNEARKRTSGDEDLVWDRISKLRSTGKNATASRSSVPSVQVKQDGVTKTLYGIRSVQQELKRHAQCVSELNLDDDTFDVGYAYRVEACLVQMRQDMQGAAGARTERDASELSSGHGLHTTTDDLITLTAMSWEPPTQQEMHYALYKLHASESGAPGVDGIMAWMLLWASDTVINVLIPLFATIWRWGVIPNCWKLGLVRWAPKGNCMVAADLTKHRPLTLRAIIGKLFTRVMLLRLKFVLEPHIPHTQVGYQAQLDSTSALWALRQLMEICHKRGTPLWLLLCDWSKAYDKVWRALMLLLINSLGVHGPLWMLVDEWVHDSVLIATFNMVVSEAYKVDTSLGQGCVLSALLFLMVLRCLTELPPDMLVGWPHAPLVVEAYKHSLAQLPGVHNTLSRLTEQVRAIIAADDTTLVTESEREMADSVECLKEWKRTCRYVSNDSKYQLGKQLPANKSRPLNRRMSSDPRHGVVVGAAVISPKVAPILLGSILCGTQDTAALWAHHAPRVCQHQVTLGKIWVQASHEECRLYVAACVLSPLMTDAAANTSTLENGALFDRLQRALWCGGDPSALGVRRTSDARVTHRIIGQLTWHRELRVQRAILWRRLTAHLRHRSWPMEVARTIKEEAEHEALYGKPIDNSFVAAVHKDLQSWGLSAATQIEMPTPCLKARASQEQLRMQCVKKSVLIRGDQRRQHTVTCHNGPRDAAYKLAARWADCKYDARLFDTTATRRALDDVNNGDEGDAHADVHTESEGEEEDEHAHQPHGNRTTSAIAENNRWERALREAAVEEQISEWGKEQDEHTPGNALMGVGEMAMWNALHPAVDGRLPGREWGALHQAQHIISRSQKEVWLRAVAGCSRYTTVYAARQGSYQEFRSPHTDAQKLAVLQCPCGMGVQDSMHVLLCEDRALVALRREVLAISEKCVHRLPVGGGNKRHKTNCDATARRALQPRREHLPRAEMRRDGNTDGWMAATDTQKLMASLGSHCTRLPKRVHLHVISEAAAPWGDLERIYASVNKVTL